MEKEKVCEKLKEKLMIQLMVKNYCDQKKKNDLYSIVLFIELVPKKNQTKRASFWRAPVIAVLTI